MSIGFGQVLPLLMVYLYSPAGRSFNVVNPSKLLNPGYDPSRGLHGELIWFVVPDSVEDTGVITGEVASNISHEIS